MHPDTPPPHPTPPPTCVVPLIDGDTGGNALTGRDGGQSLAIDPGVAGAAVWATGGGDSLIRCCSYTAVTRGHRRLNVVNYH